MSDGWVWARAGRSGVGVVRRGVNVEVLCGDSLVFVFFFLCVWFEKKGIREREEGLIPYGLSSKMLGSQWSFGEGGLTCSWEVGSVVLFCWGWEVEVKLGGGGGGGGPVFKGLL